LKRAVKAGALVGLKQSAGIKSTAHFTAGDGWLLPLLARTTRFTRSGKGSKEDQTGFLETIRNRLSFNIFISNISP